MTDTDSNAERQLELLAPRLYEELALALRALAYATLEPTPDNVGAVGKAVKAYQRAWIRAARHGTRPADDEHAERLTRRLVELAAQAVDGSLIEPQVISDELRETLDRLRSQHGDDPELDLDGG